MVVGMATGVTAHLTTGPHTVAVVDDPTAKGTVDQVGLRAATVNLFDQETVGSRTATDQGTTIVDTATGATTTMEAGKDNTKATGTMILANEGTSLRLRGHGLLSGCFHLIYLLLFLPL